MLARMTTWKGGTGSHSQMVPTQRDPAQKFPSPKTHSLNTYCVQGSRRPGPITTPPPAPGSAVRCQVARLFTFPPWPLHSPSSHRCCLQSRRRRWRPLCPLGRSSTPRRCRQCLGSCAPDSRSAKQSTAVITQDAQGTQCRDVLQGAAPRDVTPRCYPTVSSQTAAKLSDAQKSNVVIWWLQITCFQTCLHREPTCSPWWSTTRAWTRLGRWLLLGPLPASD